MTSEQRKQVKALAAERRKLQTPVERIAFDNDPENGPVGIRILAAMEDTVRDEPPKGNVPPSERIVVTDVDRDLLA